MPGRLTPCRALWALALAVAKPTPAATIDPHLEDNRQRWTLRNASVERVLELTPAGVFRTARFRSLPGGRNVMPRSLSSPEFRLLVRRSDAAAVELTGESGWSLVAHEDGVDENGTAWLAITLDALNWPLAVTVRYLCHPGSTAVRTNVTVANTGRKGAFTLLAADSFCLRVLSGTSPALLWVRNFTWAQPDVALLPEEELLADGVERRLTTGPFGSAAAWLAVQTAEASGGVFAGWEWSGTGELAIRYARTAGALGSVTLRAGLAAGTFEHALAPGERFEAPAGFVGIYDGTWDDAAAATRSFVDRCLAPTAPVEPFPLAGFDTWGYGEVIDEALVHHLVDLAADLGLELFTLDAGWMAALGDFTARPGAFDGGITAIADHAHARGMLFGLWIALGSADPSAPILRDHPSWRATAGGRPVVGDFQGHAVCLANPDARAAVLDEADRVIDAYHVDFLVHDFQVIERCDDRRHGHQVGDGDWATTAGYYALLDELRARHPGLVLSNCWDGGNMLDFGMAARHHTTNLNDGNDAVGNRRAVFGASYFLPARYLEKYAGDDGTPPACRFRSALPGGTLHVMGRPTQWDDATFAEARQAIGLFKEMRGILSGATVVHLTPPPAADSWDALLHYDAGSGRGVVWAFRGPEAPPTALLRLCGLEPGASFGIALDDGTGATPIGTKSGLELADDGLLVAVPEPGDGAIVLVTRGE